ncbi:MAG: glutathione S-transferase N-terminal domain-containing protein [Deltaproteobacteria bacterium]|nr:glutathione S-transferase N-terminal domain-containing protein [Deltaproteobacteria bacterium]MBW2360456.1 glutathione S-transferase N-terminal domain-containing protein [Deltaproteobacteria bacterium]
MKRALAVTSSLATTLARLGSGAQVAQRGRRPAQLLELYEFEACPFCRKAREALSILDLDALIRPCPKGGPNYREEVKARGGKAMFPYLVDPNTGQEMYESDDIVAYLFAQYGEGEAPRLLRPGALNDATAMLASLWRPAAGARYRQARRAERPLELWSYEASPFCRLVREKLSSLELSYRLHNVAKGGQCRDAFVSRSGRMQVPYLVDPNTGREMFESADITRYLEETYAVAS